MYANKPCEDPAMYLDVVGPCIADGVIVTTGPDAFYVIELPLTS